eukprot:gnl/Spiro4/23776_TR11760_c0_g1_i1.p2 gnl/Spiro4/23776_TR11760_c0_g1~~gnl/Spiro4/23776_TR11760_c0_g1_i1.p2  ORF type:complete len:495 (-),score=99.25 gnl/Spiro4/23776_TR11760_c0_g1_i1:91-1452(-)
MIQDKTGMPPLQQRLIYGREITTIEELPTKEVEVRLMLRFEKHFEIKFLDLNKGVKSHPRPLSLQYYTATTSQIRQWLEEQSGVAADNQALFSTTTGEVLDCVEYNFDRRDEQNLVLVDRTHPLFADLASTKRSAWEHQEATKKQTEEETRLIDSVTNAIVHNQPPEYLLKLLGEWNDLVRTGLAANPPTTSSTPGPPPSREVSEEIDRDRPAGFSLTLLGGSSLLHVAVFKRNHTAMRTLVEHKVVRLSATGRWWSSKDMRVQSGTVTQLIEWMPRQHVLPAGWLPESDRTPEAELLRSLTLSDSAAPPAPAGASAAPEPKPEPVPLHHPGEYTWPEGLAVPVSTRQCWSGSNGYYRWTCCNSRDALSRGCELDPNPIPFAQRPKQHPGHLVCYDRRGGVHECWTGEYCPEDEHLKWECCRQTGRAAPGCVEDKTGCTPYPRYGLKTPMWHT